jgi:hypothetical protein
MTPDIVVDNSSAKSFERGAYELSSTSIFAGNRKGEPKIFTGTVSRSDTALRLEE